MVYHLNKTELSQISTWSAQLSGCYSESDAIQLCNIARKALANGYLDENDVYELLDLLPRIIPEPEEQEIRKSDDDIVDWQEYMDEHQVKYKREMDKLRQTLSNWIFLQSAVYRKNIKPVESSIGRICTKANEPGIKNIR